MNGHWGLRVLNTWKRVAVVDGSRFGGRVPCVFCHHVRRRKTKIEWVAICGRCRDLSTEEVHTLYWNQEGDPDRVVVAPNIFRLSRNHSDARYSSALQRLRAWPVAPRGRILDVGCGISTQAEMLHAFAYVGADLNRVRLEFGARGHAWARYAAQSVTNLGFASHAFDAVLCLEVVEHLPPEAHLGLVLELLRVLRPGGLLVLTTPDGQLTTAKWIFGSKCEDSHERELSQAEVEALLRAAGARVIECSPLANLVQPAGWLGAALAHLVADRPKWRERLARSWARVGYRTLLYTATRP